MYSVSSKQHQESCGTKRAFEATFSAGWESPRFVCDLDGFEDERPSKKARITTRKDSFSSVESNLSDLTEISSDYTAYSCEWSFDSSDDDNDSLYSEDIISKHRIVRSKRTWEDLYGSDDDIDDDTFESSRCSKKARVCTMDSKVGTDLDETNDKNGHEATITNTGQAGHVNKNKTEMCAAKLQSKKARIMSRMEESKTTEAENENNAMEADNVHFTLVNDEDEESVGLSLDDPNELCLYNPLSPLFDEETCTPPYDPNEPRLYNPLSPPFDEETCTPPYDPNEPSLYNPLSPPFDEETCTPPYDPIFCEDLGRLSTNGDSCSSRPTAPMLVASPTKFSFPSS